MRHPHTGGLRSLMDTDLGNYRPPEKPVGRVHAPAYDELSFPTNGEPGMRHPGPRGPRFLMQQRAPRWNTSKEHTEQDAEEEADDVTASVETHEYEWAAEDEDRPSSWDEWSNFNKKIEPRGMGIRGPGLGGMGPRPMGPRGNMSGTGEFYMRGPRCMRPRGRHDIGTRGPCPGPSRFGEPRMTHPEETEHTNVPTTDGLEESVKEKDTSDTAKPK